MPGFMERITPWECRACGRKNISANLGTCPQCGARRGSTEAPTTPVATTTTAVRSVGGAQKVVTYTGEKAMQRGISSMARQGWRVVSQSSYQPRAGVGRILLIGVFAAIWKPKTRFQVVFERA